jgi:hypothetical protein
MKKQQLDFYQMMVEIGIAETRIESLIEGLNSIYRALSLMDDENLERLKQIGGLDNLFELYLRCCKQSKQITLRQYRKLELLRDK